MKNRATTDERGIPIPCAPGYTIDQQGSVRNKAGVLLKPRADGRYELMLCRNPMKLAKFTANELQCMAIDPNDPWVKIPGGKVIRFTEYVEMRRK